MTAVIPTRDSFYISGGTLPTDATSYVERAADQDLMSALLAGQYCYVLNSRQMGKSSLSVRTISRLELEGVRSAFVDLTRIGAQNVTPEQWYAGLLAETGRALNFRAEFLRYWKEHQDLPPVQRYFGALREIAVPGIETPIVVFIDEIDTVRSLPFSADEFFAAVRACFNARTQEAALRRLTFCLVGSATPADLISDTRMSPFNIGRRIELRDFTPDEAAPLGRGLLQAGGSDSVLGRILYWTGGHPYLTQRLCRACVEQGAANTREVDAVCTELFLDHTAREIDDNLTFVRNRLLRSEADLTELMETHRRLLAGAHVADDETDPVVTALKLSGVARSDRGRLAVRNRIYQHVFDREWADAHMPDAALRRLQKAYREDVTKAVTLFGVLLLLPIMSGAFVNASQGVGPLFAIQVALTCVIGTAQYFVLCVLLRPEGLRASTLGLINAINMGLSAAWIMFGYFLIEVMHIPWLSWLPVGSTTWFYALGGQFVLAVVQFNLTALVARSFAARDRFPINPVTLAYVAAAGNTVGSYITAVLLFMGDLFRGNTALTALKDQGSYYLLARLTTIVLFDTLATAIFAYAYETARRRGSFLSGPAVIGNLLGYAVLVMSLYAPTPPRADRSPLTINDPPYYGTAVAALVMLGILAVCARAILRQPDWSAGDRAAVRSE